MVYHCMSDRIIFHRLSYNDNQNTIRLPQSLDAFRCVFRCTGFADNDRYAQVFSRMKVEVPHYRELVTAVEGDIADDGLGLSSADRQLLTDNVHVVFHSAADVRFAEPLRVAIASNVLGSKRVMELARQMTNLKVNLKPLVSL